jgi:hypothetical protein
MKLRGVLHKKECKLNKRNINGVEIKIDPGKLRKLSQNLLNIKDIRKYKFFCPCNPNGLMNAETLLNHID